MKTVHSLPLGKVRTAGEAELDTARTPRHQIHHDLNLSGSGWLARNGTGRPHTPDAPQPCQRLRGNKLSILKLSWELAMIAYFHECEAGETALKWGGGVQSVEEW